MNTTDYNNPAWLARNCEESDPFEMACRVQIERLMARNAELEQQLEAIGAGGVGPLLPIKRPDHADRPTAWLITDHAGRLGGGEWITSSKLDMKEAREEGCQVEPLWAEQRIARKPLTAARVTELAEEIDLGTNPFETVRRIEEEHDIFMTREMQQCP